jgi:hypothetical protein
MWEPGVAGGPQPGKQDQGTEPVLGQGHSSGSSPALTPVYVQPTVSLHLCPPQKVGLPKLSPPGPFGELEHAQVCLMLTRRLL